MKVYQVFRSICVCGTKTYIIAVEKDMILHVMQ